MPELTDETPDAQDPFMTDPRRRPGPTSRKGLGLVVIFIVVIVAATSIHVPAAGVLGAIGGPVPAASVAATAPAPPSLEPTSTEATIPTPTPPLPAPSPTPSYKPGPFAMDIYRRGAFVSQIDKHHCMSAAMQNILNLIGPTIDTSVATQKRISALALRLSTDTLDHSWGPQGWASGLTRLGAGRYEVRVFNSRSAALRAAVVALRTTGRPVGILAWWGAHSWVLTGFKANADPAHSSKFTVSAYNIVDPWYPRVSTIWGRSAPPDALHSPANMIHNLPAWTRPEGHYPGRDGKWLLVVPVGRDVPRLTAAGAALPSVAP